MENTTSKWVVYGVIALILVAVGYFLYFKFEGKSSSSKPVSTNEVQK